ncbi:MAG: CinA family protein, partial [Candidatus Dormibacteria bacterium]
TGPRRGRAGAVAPVAGAAIVAGLVLIRRRRRRTLPPIPVATAEPLIAALSERHLTVATAESCSGGVLSALLSSVPGAGDVFRGGVVAYTTDLKHQLLHVPADVVERHGVVSDAVARAMAHGARRHLEADLGLAVTGLIGAPQEGKPSGLVYVAVAGPDGAERCVELADNHGPEGNREEAARVAFAVGRELVADRPGR